MKRFVLQNSTSLWKNAGACVQGRSHLGSNIPCQDKIYFLERRGTCAIALADGAGSCKLSHVGAEVVAREICNLLVSRFDELRKYEPEKSKKVLLTEILEVLEQKRRELAVPQRELASTLLFVAVKNGKFLAGHLGDGIIGMVNNRAPLVLSAPERGEFANTTTFVTSADARNNFRLYHGGTKKLEGFIMMSDGTGESLYDKRNNALAPAVLQMLEWLEQYPAEKVAQAIRNNLDGVIKQTTHDDCSLNMLCRDKLVPPELFLSPKKQGILRLLQELSAGFGQKEMMKKIRAGLGISRKEVMMHIRQLRAQGFISRVGLYRYALRK